MNKCLKCGDSTSNPKFCSLSCSASYNNRGVRRHGNSVGTCKWCGGDKNTSRSEFCSQTCVQAFKRKESIQSWLDGEWDGSTERGYISKTIRDYVLEEAEYMCSLCGWNEPHPQLGYAPVQVDHIDGNWKNNRPTNVRAICPNCHSLTENFGALNKSGNGRRVSGGAVGSRN